ncbi:aminotransferase [Bradyrhizobium sp. Arg237L]|uniref:aminotransferase n=1 Tax=Bradyrhizobium sp. Arg237L TaxID=3003352 RepID=UPI00249E64AD|nr:aminotransferase [Bradyrhizobium sp. Arg237L]MDI4237676.1 aminotransferase [Bradyrhizobium sp. Arg237L]
MLDTRTTDDWQALDGAHHVHSFTDPALIASGKTRIVVRGEGCQIWDSDGRRFLDGMAGLWCVNVGYGRQELIDAVTRQMAELPFYSNHFQSTTPAMTALAHRLSTLTPEGLDHFLFTSSGSEANDTVVRMVRYFWKLQGAPRKRIFISRTMAYHGSTLAAASLCGLPHMHAMDGGTLPDFTHIVHPHWYGLGGTLGKDEFGLQAAQALEQRILELGPENVAAFIGEPVQGAGGVIDPPSTYWPEIQRICRKYDVLLVADEVICGFGRTGSWFGAQTFGITPDVMTMAKGLSSGYLPIAAVAMNRRVFETISGGGHLAHGYTYSGHPVACAVALANIDIIAREGLVDRVREDIGPYLHETLARLTDSPIVGEKRGIGALAALQLIKNKATREPFTVEEGAGIFCREACYARGLIVRAVGQSIVLSPSLVITHAEIDELAEKLADALEETARHFRLL